MVRRKDPFWNYVEDLENGRVSCNFCKRDFAGGISRIKSHLSGVKGRDIEICQKVPDDIKLKALPAINYATKRAKSMAASNPTKRTKSMASSNSFLEDESVSGPSSSWIAPNLFEGQDKSLVDKQLAKFIRSERISSDVIRSPVFKDFVNAVAEHGPSYQLPSSFTLESRLMPDIVREVDEYFKNVIKYSAKTGCTLIYSRWLWKKSFLDIFAYTPIGVVCMDPPMSYVMNSFQQVLGFQETMTSIMELIEPTNVVQFIINDGDRAYSDEVSSTRDMLCRKYPWIYWTPCATRGIRLLLGKIYDVPFVWNTIKVAKWIVLYIYKYKVNVPIKRVRKMEDAITSDSSMLKSVLEDQEDAIGSDFSMLTSLLEVESELQALQVSIGSLSSNWGKPLREKHMTNFINYAIRCKEFWSGGKMVAQVIQQIFEALCLVRCDGPTSGYLYEMMERVQDAVKQCCDSNHAFYDVICEILSGVRRDIIHPIHAAAAFLNPIYMCNEKFMENIEMRDGVNYIVEHLVAEEEKEAFVKQVQLYRMKDLNVFTAQARMMLTTSHPQMWWKFCGKHLPVLQKYAIRILSQPCSSSLCERYQLRNSNLHDRAFMVNTMMMERYKSQGTQMIEPIILDKLGEVYDDSNYQRFRDAVWDNDWDDDWDVGEYECFFNHWTDSLADDIIKDPTGSWLDWWPKE